MAQAKEIASSVLKQRAGAGAGAQSILNKDLQETLDLFRSTLAQDAKKIADGAKPFFRDAEEAAKYWDEVYKKISTNMTQGIYPIGPNAPRITYKKDGQLFTLDRSVKPPEGAERVSLTDSDVIKLMPPRPQVPPKAAGEPNGYNNPPPPDYLRIPERPASAPRPETPQRPLYEGPGASGSGGAGAPPSPSASASVAASEPSKSTSDLARTILGGARARDFAAIAAPAAVLGTGAAMKSAADNGPYGTSNYADKVPNQYTGDLLDNLRGFGDLPGFQPSFKQPNEPRVWRDELPPYMSPREESPNLDVFPHDGPGVSADPSDFVSDNVAERFATAPAHAGRENPGRDLVLGQEQRFRPQYDAGQAQRFNPEPVSIARQVVQRAQNVQSQRQAAEDVLKQSPNQLSVQKAPEQQQAGALARLIRGDFSEGADARIAEALRRQREESGVEPGMATGGAAKAGKMNKDDILHKALEIIHHMLTRR